MTEIRHAPSFHSDRIDESALDQLVGVLDMQAELPSIQRMRRWALDVLAVRPGESALDIGSGTGSEVIAFEQATGPNGEAVGVDPNPAMLAVAAERAEKAHSAARFVEGNAYHLPFDDESFDAVRCERVYQHLDHPDQATREIARVLRPGGRVVLIDSDWATSITHPGDPEVIRVLVESMETSSPNRNSGRRLRGLLSTAGLVIDDIGSEAVIWNQDIASPMYRFIGEQAVSDGIITEAQNIQLIEDLDKGFETGDFHLSVTMFAVLAHKPQ